jgi:hypothetical protein
MQISKNFSDVDVSFDLIAIKNKINNVAPRPVLLAAEDLAANVLEPLKEKFDFRIVSWYRSAVLEREYCKGSFHEWTRAKGVAFNDRNWYEYLKEKQHVLGSAVAIVGSDNSAIFEWLQTQTFDILQMRDGYIHVSFVKDANRMLVLS